jgi:biopolymer transport protein ExbD
MNFNRGRQDDVDINVTSLIDVVLLLLIFFMVSTTFLNPAQINLSLPQAASGEKQETPKAIEVTVDKEGRYFVNGKALINAQTETLKTGMRDALADLKDPPVIVHADAKATHQAVINVLDVARQLGLLKISFATETGDGSAAAGN